MPDDSDQTYLQYSRYSVVCLWCDLGAGYATCCMQGLQGVVDSLSTTPWWKIASSRASRTRISRGLVSCIRVKYMTVKSEIGDQDIKIVAKNRRIRMKRYRDPQLASYDVSWESYESRNMHTNSLIKIITLEIFYFGQGTNHKEFSVSLQRGCRLAPLQSVSNLRNAAEGSKLELFSFFWRIAYFWHCACNTTNMNLERRERTCHWILEWIPFQKGYRFQKMTKYKSRWVTFSCPHSCMHHTYD